MCCRFELLSRYLKLQFLGRARGLNKTCVSTPVTAPEDNHEVSSDNTGEDITLGENTSPTSDLQTVTTPEDNHQVLVSSDNTGEDNTSGEDTSPTSDPPIQASEGNHEVSADNTNEASSGETGKK